MSTAITLTTINKPIVLEAYLVNIKKYDYQDIEIIIVGDKKTPTGLSDYCHKLTNNYSTKVRYLDVEFQEKYLRKLPLLAKHLPYNSFARRNIGDLVAYEEGFSSIIRVDDDNFPIDDDFIGMHNIVDKVIEVDLITTESGWFNICEELIDKDDIPFYPRGFPYSKRWVDDRMRTSKKKVPVSLNAGLWLGDPDVDAVTRLCKPIDAIKYKSTYGDNFALAIGTWCPINTQNTAYSRQIIPASFIPPNVGRYDDIWSGYLLRKIIDHLGDYVSFGRPLLHQVRNVHNLWQDLKNEMNGNIHTDHLVDCLRKIDLKNRTYLDCYYELAENLEGIVSENTEEFKNVINGMKIWADSISKITG